MPAELLVFMVSPCVLPITRKKTDVVEYLEVFDHVATYSSTSPLVAPGCPSSSHPTTFSSYAAELAMTINIAAVVRAIELFLPLGHLRAHRKPCRHVAGLLQLHADGKLLERSEPNA